MILKMLTWVFCGLCLSLDIQFAGLILDYRPRNIRALDIFLITLVTSPSILLAGNNDGDAFPYPLRLTVFAVYFIGQLSAYFFVYRKIGLRLLYFYLLTFNIPQIFYNIISAFTDNYVLANVISFALNSLLSALLIVYMDKKGNLPFIRDLTRAVPAGTYILLLVFMFIASVFVEVENRHYSAVLTEAFLLIVMAALIAAAVTVVRISISETEKRFSVKLLSNQAENQIAYYKKINRIYDEFSSFRHDYKNHVLCLRSLIAAGKTDEALEYMQTMQEMSSVDKNRYHTGNVIIDALLDDKSETAKQAGASLVFAGNVPDNGISSADLCIIIANSVDNAIEACAKDDSGEMKEIKIESGTRQGYYYFKAVNPFFETVTIHDDKRIATSKSDKENHGRGISNIVMAAERYEGETNISAENGVFSIEVMLHLKTDN